jgi:hypothetical protein
MFPGEFYGKKSVNGLNTLIKSFKEYAENTTVIRQGTL